MHRRDKLRAEKIMQDKLFEKQAAGKIEIIWNHSVDEVLGDETGVTGVRVKSTTDGSTRDIAVTGMFVAIGHTPNTSIFEGQLDMRNGYITIRTGLEGNATATSVPGVFAAGWCAIAAGWLEPPNTHPRQGREGQIPQPVGATSVAMLIAMDGMYACNAGAIAGGAMDGMVACKAGARRRCRKSEASRLKPLPTKSLPSQHAVP